LVQKKSFRVGSESIRVKSGSASYLLRVKSKLGSGQGPSLVSKAPISKTNKSKFVCKKLKAFNPAILVVTKKVNYDFKDVLFRIYKIVSKFLFEL